MQQNHHKAQIVVFAKSPKNLEVLLFQTNKNRGGFWQNITGSVEKNESFLMGALREFHEETGIGYDQIQTLELLKCHFEFTDQFQREVLEKCFVIHLIKKIDPILDPSEHQSFRWVHIDKISMDDYKYPSNFEAFAEAKNLC